jgi:hypothetical protein
MAGYDLMPYANIELVVRNLLRSALYLQEGEFNRIGRDAIGDLGTRPWYVRVMKVAGSSGDRLEGDFMLDVETFAKDYNLADSLARGIEAVLLGYPHVVGVDTARVVIDSVYQNTGPHEVPWEDPTVNRILATYTFTVRR